MVTDPIANFITAIKNAAQGGKGVVRTPYSQIKQSIAEVLQKEGFLSDVSKKGKKGGRPSLEVTVATDDMGSRVHDVKRVSKPSRRVYYAVKDIVPVRRGYGRVILSTPKGVLTGDAARKEKVGGEALFEIW
ncbi:MAG: 30S ribosomal protein S8 [Patescibacteria group bacterium]